MGLVKCDICEKMFNVRYVASHKRLSHGVKATAAERKQQQTMQEIVALYKKLPAESRKELLEELKGLPD